MSQRVSQRAANLEVVVRGRRDVQCDKVGHVGPQKAADDAVAGLVCLVGWLVGWLDGWLVWVGLVGWLVGSRQARPGVRVYVRPGVRVYVR